jgi:hypothetical protein
MLSQRKRHMGSKNNSSRKRGNIMKNLLTPAAIALAIGAGSVPATANVVEEVTYHDRNNTIVISTKKENSASETFEAVAGQADNRFRPAVIYFCQGGPGSTVSDELVISVRTPPCAQAKCATK